MSQEQLDKNLFNIDFLILAQDQLRQMGEVTKLNVFEQNSNVFAKDGLFSTEIFGPIGTDIRSETPGYIDLHVDIMHPLVYQQLTSLKSFYSEIISGKKKAIFDNKEKDFVLSDDPKASTGYTFFMENIDKVKFNDNGSDQRKFKIELVKKFLKQDTEINKWLVLPAGLRDYELDKNDNPSEDEVNDLYRKLLGTVSMLKNTKVSKDNMAMLDPIRLKIQNITLEIYNYFKVLLDGKNKFIQGKWAKRAIMHGTRNVITPIVETTHDLDNENSITFNHTVVGAYQYIKAIPPILANKLHTMFIGRIMNPDSDSAVLVNPKTMKTEIVNISVKRRDEWLSLEGLSDITSKLAQDDIKREPVKIDGYYMFLLYDDGKNVEIIFDTNNLPEDMDTKYLRPITYIELVYLAIYDVRNKYPAFLTRYPVAAMGGVYPTKLYVKTTVKGRTVNFKYNNQVKEVVEYPNLKEEFVNSLSPHLSKLERLTADFDGDTMSMNVLYTEESIKEIENMFNSKEFYITPDGEIAFTMSQGVTELVIAHMTA